MFFVKKMPGWWNWYTRTSQKRMPYGLRVRVSLRVHWILQEQTIIKDFQFHHPN